MIATSAKLRELLEAASPVDIPEDASDDYAVRISGVRFRAKHTLQRAAPDLARLVLTLSEALIAMNYCHGCLDNQEDDTARSALAAVEELEL